MEGQIKVNVMGTIFHVKRSDVVDRGDWLLKMLVESKHPAHLINDTFCLDCDPESFRLIYLILTGTAKLKIMPLSNITLNCLASTCDYLLLSELAEEVRQKINFGKHDEGEKLEKMLSKLADCHHVSLFRKIYQQIQRCSTQFEDLLTRMCELQDLQEDFYDKNCEENRIADEDLPECIQSELQTNDEANGKMLNQQEDKQIERCSTQLEELLTRMCEVQDIQNFGEENRSGDETFLNCSQSEFQTNGKMLNHQEDFKNRIDENRLQLNDQVNGKMLNQREDFESRTSKNMTITDEPSLMTTFSQIKLPSEPPSLSSTQFPSMMTDTPSISPTPNPSLDPSVSPSIEPTLSPNIGTKTDVLDQNAIPENFLHNSVNRSLIPLSKKYVKSYCRVSMTAQRK